jgi:hypothetical protein
MRKQPTGGA